jgi:peptide deformylase
MISLLLYTCMLTCPLGENSALPICPCDIASEEIQHIIDKLCLEADSKSLAAPQIGINRRILVIEGKEFINPEIIWRSVEGDHIVVFAYDREANCITKEWMGSDVILFEQIFAQLGDPS